MSWGLGRLGEAQTKWGLLPKRYPQVPGRGLHIVTYKHYIGLHIVTYKHYIEDYI
jgi:hypothetical protein